MKFIANLTLYKISLQFIFFVIAGFLNLNSFSQTFKIGDVNCDSLEIMIAKAPTDSAKARLSYLLMKKTLRTDVDKAFGIAKQENKYAVNSGDQSSIAKSYDGLGLCYEYKFQFNTAISYYSKALDIRLRLNDVVETAADCGNIGTVYLEKSDYPSALDFLLRSLKIIEDNKKEFPDNIRLKYIKANSLANIGLLYYQSDKLEKALEYNEDALKVYTELHDTKNVISASSTIANIYASQKEFKKALALQKQALSMNSKMDDPYMKGNLTNNIGNAFESLGELDSALYYFKLGLTIPEIAKDDRELAIVYHNIGDLKFRKGNEKEGFENINHSLTLSLKSKDIELESVNYETLYEYYNKHKEFEKALTFYRSYVATRDSIYNEENTRKTVQSEMTYEFGKKEAIAKAEQDSKDALTLQQQQRERIVRNAFIAGFALVFLLALVVFRGYRQKQKANHLLAEQKTEIEGQKTQIEDSIGYARYIQRAILPAENDIVSSFKDIFGYYKPKDVVSGDFYWFAKHEDKTLIAVADCTGHGVPGAFMSLIGSDKLNQIVHEKGITKPSEILSALNKGVKKTLKQNEKNSVSRDGMDIALCSFDLKKLTMEYAGANRPLYLIRDNQLHEYGPTKSPIGGLTDDNKQFDNNIVELKEGDRIYLFSDGFVDQFGGERQKKFMTRQFKEVLLEIHEKPMKEQEFVLDKAFQEWKGELEQVDDILVIGIAI